MLGTFGEIHRLGSGTDSLRQSTNTEYLVEMEGMNSHLPAGSSKEHLNKEGDPRQLGDPSPCLWFTEQPTSASLLLGCVGSYKLEAEGWT